MQAMIQYGSTARPSGFYRSSVTVNMCNLR